jgi:hypothetical protein
MSLLKNKKGVDLIHGTVIFIILNLIFFGAMFGFVVRTADNIALYEQAYAKELSLLIDKSKPGTVILLDVKDINGFLKNGNLYDSAFSFSNNKVTVKLNKDSQGYSFPYFSDYLINGDFQIDENKNAFLRLEINDN